VSQTCGPIQGPGAFGARSARDTHLAGARRRPAPPYIWSKGISRSCDFSGSPAYWLEDTESCQPESFFREHYADAGGLVWVRLGTRSRDGLSCDLDHFVRGALPTIRKPFALITTDGDASVPSELSPETVRALLACPWLVAWHTQNNDGSPHRKLAPLPIGLDLHTPRPRSSPRRLMQTLRKIRHARPPPQNQPLRVFCDFRISMSSDERWRALVALRGCDHVDFLSKRVPQEEIWSLYSRYPLVLSASGNGLDCHRTWELLLLGSVVVTRTSPLDPLFEDLPVAIVNDWTAVRDKANLEAWRQHYGPLTERTRVWRRLRTETVLQPVRAHLAAAT
jgi:hypothetical protein